MTDPPTHYTIGGRTYTAESLAEMRDGELDDLRRTLGAEILDIQNQLSQGKVDEAGTKLRFEDWQEWARRAKGAMSVRMRFAAMVKAEIRRRKLAGGWNAEKHAPVQRGRLPQPRASAAVYFDLRSANLEFETKTDHEDVDGVLLMVRDREDGGSDIKLRLSSGQFEGLTKEVEAS